MLLFILSLNPLSFLLKDAPGYKLKHENQSININHLSFVDDLKLFATTLNNLKLLLDIVITLSKDIGMKFGLNKCAYIYTERGRRKSLGDKIVVNEVEISELEEGDLCKYLEIDEDIGYEGPLNKDRIGNEFLHGTKKIWNSELYSRKVTAYNTFALPVLTMSVGVLDWSEQELMSLDIKARKILNISGSFHSKGDTNRLYVPRSNGGRGLNSVINMFKNRMVNLSNYLKQVHHNLMLETVKIKGLDNIIRIG